MRHFTLFTPINFETHSNQVLKQFTDVLHQCNDKIFTDTAKFV